MSLEIRHGGHVRASVPLTLAPSAPGVFAAVLDSTKTVAVIYVTGLGVEGLPLSVTIGNQPAEILYAGALAGYPGVHQINVAVPQTITESAQVIVSSGDGVSQPGITIDLH